jgi:predicted alpha/beta-fold hydrolase
MMLNLFTVKIAFIKDLARKYFSGKFIIKSSFFSLFIYLLLKQIPSKNKVHLIYKKNAINLEIANSLKPLCYKPTIYLPHYLLQMLYNEFKPIPHVKFFREYIKSKDGGIFSLDWEISESFCSTEETNKILVLMHGLTGGSESGYIREIIQKFSNSYKIVVVQNRGINDTPLFTPFTYHANWSQDFKIAIEIIKQRYPKANCFTLGISMGSNILTNFFGTDHSLDDYVKCFISISNPFTIVETEKRNRGNVLDMLLTGALKEYFSEHSILEHHSKKL